MLRIKRLTYVAVGLLLANGSWAQAPAGAPAGATGLCRDGSAWAGATKKGACKGHKGVKEWYGAAGASAAPAATSAAAAGTVPPAAAPVSPTKPVKSNTAMLTTAAPGGGPGLVWANKSSKVYHCPTDKWYGKTKDGAYMSEADAKAHGYHADHGKACQ